MLGVILALSLGFKASGQISGTEAPADGNADVLAFLQTHGFVVDEIHPDSLWISAAAGDCTLQIATVSPLGWERDVIVESAGTAKLSYVFAGQTYAEQPVLQTALTHYWQRLRGYVRLPSHQYRVRAVIAGDRCPPAMLKPESLADLSR
jgi:hypothetical protein